MKKLIFMLLSLLIINVAYAQSDDWSHNSESLIIDVSLSSGADILPKSSDYNIEYIKVNLSHYPYESFNQEVLSFNPYPEAKTEGNTLQYEWKSPRQKIEFGYNAQIRTTNDIVEIREKISFPLQNIPEELKIYTQPAEIIDSDNEDIIALASSIAEGEDDLYIVVHELAEWTKINVEYDLSTLTADVSQKASWVLENRQGVCDELTSLFIAMARSLGIPARFVSGMAYTNSPLFPENWGSHGWAEIYFPGYGWVPYDVTYGQFGYIDPTHIKLKESIDSAEPSVSYKWLASGIELDTKELDLDAEVKEKNGRQLQPVSISIDLLKESIGFGSYDLVEVTLENNDDYYLSTELYLSKPKEMSLQGSFAKNIFLKPGESKSVFWIVSLPEDLERNYVYTFPITVSTLGNQTRTAYLKSSEDDVVLSFYDVDEVMRQRTEEETKEYSRDVEMECSAEKTELYSYEDSNISCTVKNTGNTFLEALNICMMRDCTLFDLGIAQEKSFNFSPQNMKEEKQQLAITLSNDDVSKAAYLDMNVLDMPEIAISRLEFPKEAEYNDNPEISFILEKSSSSNPKNVELILSNSNFRKQWMIEELFESRKFIITLHAKELKKGQNNFEIHASYQDANGKNYESSESFSIELVNVTFIQNILLSINSLLLSLEDPKNLMVFVVGSILVFVLIIWLVFRRK